jgi:LmbE family N-acetylglucosaminyl deacetylase
MKPLVCVFAHPDDESFGPGGTIAIEAKRRGVYIICVTQGDAGENSSKQKRPLNEIRKDELLASAKLLGVKKIFFLDYNDGKLSNSLYYEIADKIQTIINKIKPGILLTFDLRGVSGHIDHIAIAMITSYVFERSPFIKEIWYYVMTKEYEMLVENHFIFFPPGYTKSEISKTVDTEKVWKHKVAAMYLHESQLHDAKKVLSKLEKLPREEHFIIRKQKKASKRT